MAMANFLLSDRVLGVFASSMEPRANSRSTIRFTWCASALFPSHLSAAILAYAKFLLSNLDFDKIYDLTLEIQGSEGLD